MDGLSMSTWWHMLKMGRKKNFKKEEKVKKFLEPLQLWLPLHGDWGGMAFLKLSKDE